MSFKIKDIVIENNVVLAPMAGVSNLAYRKMCKKYGAGMVVTEMISDKGLFYHDKKTEILTALDESEHPVGIQIFGGDLHTLLYAAKYVDEKTNADFIDINMGCPVPKVLKSNAGSKYLQDVDRIYQTVSEIVKNVKKPVTVKVRIGWDQSSINIEEVVDAIVKAGASAITIHGRTKTDMYAHQVRYDLIKKIKELHPNFPIIANGDITSPTIAKEVLEYTKADAVMIGRASYGNPFIFTQINHYLKTGELLADQTLAEKIKVLQAYACDLVVLKGEYIALKELRAQAGWFIKGCRHGAYYRNELAQISTLNDLNRILEKVVEDNSILRE